MSDEIVALLCCYGLPTCAESVLDGVAKADWLVDIYVRTFLCCDWTILTHALSQKSEALIIDMSVFTFLM